MANFNEVLQILLPKFIIEKINDDLEGNIAVFSGDVCIVFCDIANFDEIIANENKNIIEILDNLYSSFDILCQQHGL